MKTEPVGKLFVSLSSSHLYSILLAFFKKKRITTHNIFCSVLPCWFSVGPMGDDWTDEVERSHQRALSFGLNRHGLSMFIDVYRFMRVLPAFRIFLIEIG